MKHVFDDISTIAHMWANQTQDNARNKNNNFYYDGNTIYSYGGHFPIARHFEYEGKKAVLFTERTYSNTTARHIQVVKQACRHLNIIYCCNPAPTHEENFTWWLREAESVATKLQSARKPESYLQELTAIKQRATKYAQFFNIEIPETLQLVLNIANKQEYKDYLEAKHAIIEKENKQRIAREKREFKKELNKWLNGETTRLSRHDGRDYLRMNKHNMFVETTQGVNIPIAAAKKFWQLLRDKKVKTGDELLDWTVIETGDTTRIGCHTFPTNYLIKFGEQHFNKQTASV